MNGKVTQWVKLTRLVEGDEGEFLAEHYPLWLLCIGDEESILSHDDLARLSDLAAVELIDYHMETEDAKISNH